MISLGLCLIGASIFAMTLECMAAAVVLASIAVWLILHA